VGDGAASEDHRQPQRTEHYTRGASTQVITDETMGAALPWQLFPDRHSANAKCRGAPAASPFGAPSGIPRRHAQAASHESRDFVGGRAKQRLGGPSRAQRSEQCARHGRRTDGEMMFDTS
jgi:hypothetical protein